MAPILEKKPLLWAGVVQGPFFFLIAISVVYFAKIGPQAIWGKEKSTLSTRNIMHFLANQVSPNTYVNIMDQYHTCGEAYNFPPLHRRITPEEYRQALKEAKEKRLRIMYLYS